MGSQYRDAPLVEAVCHFRFDPRSPWDDTLPGLIYDRLQKDFPIKRQATDTRLLLSNAPTGSRATDRVRFFDKEETSAVQVSPHFLSVNQLVPYPSWDLYLPKIIKAAEAYRKVVDPRGLAHVEIGYFNQIPLPEEEFALETYFNLYPAVLGDLPPELSAFLAGVQFMLDEGQSLLTAELRSAIRNDQTFALLHLTHRAVEPKSLDLDDLEGWLDRAHDEIEGVFESALTEELKMSFGEEGR